MPRVGLAILIIALAGTAPALATSEQTSETREGVPINSQGSQSASEESAGLQYVRSDCDVRRPSCRRWRALAGDRLEKSKGAD